MSAETSMDFNLGYEKCLTDLGKLMILKCGKGKLMKPIRQEYLISFIAQKDEECQKNMHKIMDEMYNEYKKDKKI